MSEIDNIKDEIEKVKTKYLNNVLDLISDYKNENQTRDDYKGRQIFELLQNADDCYSAQCNEISVKIQLKTNKLIIQNTGKPFDARGIASLMHPNASSKYEGTIGCKGLGFRSVLNWAKNITICTKEFCVNFSYDEAIKQLSYFKENANKSYINELDNIDRIPVLSSTKIIRLEDLSEEFLNVLDKDYSTCIILDCEDLYIEEIKRQLKEFQFEELLFLKHIRNIHIILETIERKIESVKDGTTYLIQEGNNKTEWTVWEKSGETLINGKQQSYELRIAYSDDSNIRQNIRDKGVLYSFFKTEIPMPFPFLIHGTFELNNARNKLIKDNPNNEALIDILIDFIVEKGVEISKKANKCDYEALEFLIPGTQLYFLDKEYDFSSKLKEKIKEFKILPTINGEYISLKDNPKYTDNEWHLYLNKQRFSNLLQRCSDKKIKEYIKENGIEFYDVNEIVSLINLDADTYVSNGDSAKIIQLFHDEANFRNSKIAPYLLTDNNNQRILDSEIKVFNYPETPFTLPSWSKLCFINKDLQEKLFSYWNITSVRTLVDNLSAFGCNEYSFDKVLTELIRQAKNNHSKVKSLLRWIFENFNSNEKIASYTKNVDIKIITRDGDIASCNKCYFGKDYGNEVGERIIMNLDSHLFIADPITLGLNDKSRDMIISFLKQLGVKKYPKLECVSLNDLEAKEYIKYNSCIYNTLTVEKNERYSCDDFFNNFQQINVNTIVGIEKILENATFEDIICWALQDRDFNDQITSQNEISDQSSMIGCPKKKIHKRTIGKSQMRSWLQKIVKEFNWLPTISGNKTNSFNCTFTNNKLSPILETLKIDYERLYKCLEHNCKKEVDAFLEKLGIADDIIDLSKQKIYEILLKLPEIDKDYSMGRKIYNQLNLYYKDDKLNKLLTDNNKYEEFKKNGKVLAEKNHKYSYLPTSQVYYVGRKIYSDDILDNYPKIVLNRRAGDQKITRMFCVQPISRIGDVNVIDIRQHILSDEYKLDFNRYLPYIYAKRIEYDHKNKEFNLLRKTNILLVSNAKTVYTIGSEQKEGNLKDYELVYSKDKIAYVKVPDNITSIEVLKNEMDFVSTIAEVITNILDVDGDKDAFTIILKCHSIKEVEDYFRNNGDDAFFTINKAKELFNTSISYEEEFIEALNQVTNKDKCELQAKCNEILGHNFNYQNINLDKFFGSIKNLFQILNIELQDFNQFSYQKIELISYYKEKIQQLKNKYRKKYLSYIITKIITDGGNKEDFDYAIRKYDFSDITIKDSFGFDIEEAFQQNFSVKISDLDNQHENFEELINQLKNDEPQNNHLEEIKPVENENKTDFKQLNEMIKTETTSDSLTPKLEALKQNHHSHTSNNQTRGLYSSQTNKQKEVYGFCGESKVYYTLLSKVGTNGSVEWLSGNAQKAGLIKNGNDALGYDIKYSDDNGIHYVEVKASKSKNVEFTLTKNEFDFAEKHKDQFEIWFVPIEGDDKPGTPLELGNILMFTNGENFFKNSRFDVEQSEFKIRAKIKKEIN